MRRALTSLVLLALAGCGTTLRVEGPGEADVQLRRASAADAEAIAIGRTAGALEWRVPADLENERLVVLVRTDFGAWRYTVFTDRDVVIHFPPKGPEGIGVGAVEAVAPEPARPAAVATPRPATATAATEPGPAARPRRPAKPVEEPSASISSD